MTQFYKPSGKFSPSFILFFLLVSLIAFPLLGLIYAYCIWYIPFIYINFFITLGFGFLVALCVNKVVIRKGKVRNPILALFIGFFAGNVALFAGCKPTTSHTIAGFSGFLGAQAFNYACLLLTTRYRRGLIRRRVQQRAT